MSAGENGRLIRSMEKTICQAFLWQGIILFFIFTLVGNATAQTCLQPPAGLVGWWPGDGNAEDIVGSNEGKLQNGATFADGKVGQAFSFNGINAFVSGDTTKGLPLGSSPRTITAWIKAVSVAPHDRLIFHYGVGNGNFPPTNFHLVMSGAGLAEVGNGFGYGLAVGTTFLGDGQFHFLAGTYEGPSTNIARIYVDGIEEGAAVISTPATPDGGFKIGQELPTANALPFHGLIDEVDIYSRALSVEEIRAIFNAGNAGKCKAPSLISNGSFEQGINPGPSFITLPAGSTAMTNWVVTSGTVDYIGPYWTAAAGQRSVDLNGNDPGAISQTFKTHPGTTYAVRFSMAGNPDGPPTTKRLHVSAGGETAELTFNTEGHSRQEMGYERRTVLFTATSPQITLAFTTLIPGPYGPAIDNVTVNETALENVDNLVHFTPESRSYHTTADATGCPSGYVGKFSFTATLGAKPTSPPLSSLVVKVAQLSNGNLLQNADGGPSGVGGLLTIPKDLGPSYSDGVLTHGENIQHIPFTICLTSKTAFAFSVDVLGTMVK